MVLGNGGLHALMIHGIGFKIFSHCERFVQFIICDNSLQKQKTNSKTCVFMKSIQNNRLITKLEQWFPFYKHIGSKELTNHRFCFRATTYNEYFVSNKLGFLHSENISSFCVLTPFNRSTFVFVNFFITDNATPGVARCLSIGFVGLFALCRKIWMALRNISSLLVLYRYPVPRQEKPS